MPSSIFAVMHAVRTRPHAEVERSTRNVQLAEEDVRHARVIVLTRVDDEILDRLARRQRCAARCARQTGASFTNCGRAPTMLTASWQVPRRRATSPGRGFQGRRESVPGGSERDCPVAHGLENPSPGTCHADDSFAVAVRLSRHASGIEPGDHVDDVLKLLLAQLRVDRQCERLARRALALGAVAFLASRGTRSISAGAAGPGSRSRCRCRQLAEVRLRSSSRSGTRITYWL